MNPLLQSVVASLKAGTQTEAIAQIDRVTKFCMDNESDKVFGGWGEDIIRLLVAYHWAKQTLLVDEEDGEIKGMFMWYKCNESDGWEFIHEWKEDRPDGDAIFLAFLCSVSPASFKRLVNIYSAKTLATTRVLQTQFCSSVFLMLKLSFAPSMPH